MLSSVLRSKRAVAVNIEIMRTFVELRRMVAEHEDLAKRIAEIEERYDGQFQVVFDAIRSLIAPHEKSRKRIGYLSTSKVAESLSSAFT